MLFSDVVKVNGINPDPNAKCEVGNSTNKEVCGFYLAGCCRFGNFCRNLHVEAAPVSQSNDEEKMECGICLSLPLDGSYGLLSDCDCIFCLKCIRSWREESGPSTTRLCPLCRTQSFFVVPSPLSLKGERRMIAIETYKSSLKKIPCKYYRQDGRCPFGSSCFYQHIDIYGNEEVAERPMYVIDQNNQVCVRSRCNLLRDYFPAI